MLQVNPLGKRGVDRCINADCRAEIESDPPEQVARQLFVAKVSRDRHRLEHSLMSFVGIF